MRRHTFQFFFIYMKPKIESLAFCYNECIQTEGGTDKRHPGQNPRQEPPRTNTNLSVKTYVAYVCMYY